MNMKMDAQKFISTFSLLTFLTFSSLFIVRTTSVCQNSACLRNEPLIRFPFRLQNHQPATCGWPGFDLSCSGTNQTLLNLPNNGQFIVQSIDYARQEILINDPNHCLPLRLLNLNLSNMPFGGVYNQDFTFFNCSAIYRTTWFNPIACLSSDNYTVFATSSTRITSFFSPRCDVIAIISVPVQSPFFDQVVGTDLTDDIRLGWGEPDCSRCEIRGGRCGFKNNSTQEIECRIRRGIPMSARYAIMFGTGLPAITMIGLVFYIFSKLKSRSRESRPDREATAAVTPQPSPFIVGLELDTINSYPKTVLGESGRLPKPDDITCPICLSEYKPKETLKTLPHCQHCFHSECIDEWLLRNATCPVCRNSPSRTPPSSNQ